MSYGTSRTRNNTPPLGLKIIVILNAIVSIFGIIGAIILSFLAIADPRASGIGVIVYILMMILLGVNLVLVYFLYKLNRTAYIVYMVLLGLSIFLNIISFEIIQLVINGIIFAYMLMISDRFG